MTKAGENCELRRDVIMSAHENVELLYYHQPSPHIFIPQLIEPDLYAQISFPNLPERPMGRIGRDLYPGEPGWDELMTSPGWREFSSAFMSEAFIRRVIECFRDDIRRLGCAIDPARVYLDPYRETRQETETSLLSETYDPNALFARFDLQAIGQTYKKSVHCDWPRRVVGGVLFLTSAADEGLEGGEFALYSDLEFQNDRVCHQPKLEKVFPVRHNQGVLFLNSNSGFHGPTPIRKMAGMRKWIYYSISSRRNVWQAHSQ
jgi:hypothetical protein